MNFETELVQFDPAPGDPLRPAVAPIYATATFGQQSAVEMGAYDYSRSGNPTRDVLERQLARLDGAVRALAYSSGMAAIDAALSTLRPGDHCLAGDDLYGGTWRLFEEYVRPRGIDVSYVDPRDLPRVRAKLTARTRLVWVETPSNPLMRVSDISALADAAHESGALLAVDNSLLSPVLQRPLECGADIVVQSATKHLSGHGDVTAGVVAVSSEKLAERLARDQNARGTALGPFDSWLLLRGMKTLALRMERAQSNARRLADWLREQPGVRRVHYAALAGGHEGEVQVRQSLGAGSVLSFETGCPDASRAIVETTKLFTTAVSFGSVHSTISLPCYMSHASIPDDVGGLDVRGGGDAGVRPPRDLVRISAGIEGAGDLIDDLAAALASAAAARWTSATPAPPEVGAGATTVP